MFPKLMDLKSPLARFTSYYVNDPSSNNHRRLHRSHISHCHTNSAIMGEVISINNRSAAQKQPLLRRPGRLQTHQRPPLTTPPIIKKRKTIPTPTLTTTSDILRLMDGLGIPVSIEMYTSLAKECTETRYATGAVELHAHLNRSGLRPKLLFLNRMLLMYVSCGLFDNARHMFDRMSNKDCNSWAVLIAGYMDNENYEEAINMFVEMKYRHRADHKDGNMLEFPVSWIVVCMLKACVQAMELGLGKQIHGWLLKVGYDSDLYLSSSLINLYGKLGCLEDVDSVFDHAACRNTVVWTAKLVNICREERFDEVLNVFKDMGREGVRKNGFTFSCVLRACGTMEDDGQCGEQVHANLIKLGLESNDSVQCGLVDMYAKFGLLNCAKMVFEMNGDERTLACWNAMLTGYIRHGYCIEAIKILYAMESVGLQPHESLHNEVLSTCGSDGNRTYGMRMN